jgi:UDPglucose 6-dehydrogenase
MNFSINICGFGYVGSAMGHLCEKNDIEFNVYDIQKKEGKFNYFNNITDLVNCSENNSEINFYIIAVPTNSDSEGNCDTSIVKNVLEQLKNNITKETYVIIKSTIVPGTSKELSEKYTNFDIIFCPEFLTQKNYLNDIYNAKFVLLGIPDKFDMTKYQKILNVMRTFYKHNTQIDIFMRSYEECELFKYTLNTYFGIKITFFNEIYDLCEKMNVDYQKLKELFSLDSRVGEYGITVPGDHGRGYHGVCIPKEVRSMIKLQEKLGLSSELMSCVNKRNNDFRSLE